MTRRYFLQNSNSQTVHLDGAEAHHLIHVMRGKVNDEVELFDGTGKTYRAKVAQLSRKEVELEIEETRLVDRELSRELTLAVAMPKGDRQKILIEKLVELGVTTLIPIGCERSVSKINEQAVTRLERTVVESCKQSGRNKLMEIQSETDFHDFAGRDSKNEIRIIAHPAPNEDSSAFEFFGSDVRTSNVQVLVGPEGGFTNEEIEFAFGKGWRTVDLGSRILRTETAAIGLAAFFSMTSKQNYDRD